MRTVCSSEFSTFR